MSQVNQEQWTAVDRYFEDLFVPFDPVLDAVLESSADAALPPHHVAPNQGKFLAILAQLSGARTVLEIGTLGGYSTIWLARALPEGGKVVTLEVEQKHADVARANVALAGLNNVVDLRVGPAIDSLSALVADEHPPFDMVFIDADKPNNPLYLEWALKLTHPGSLIVGDNVVREGKVIDGGSNDPNVQGIRRFSELLAGNPRISATAIQTVGSKGYDGFAIGVVKGEECSR